MEKELKSKDLRIGNLVYDYKNSIHKIAELVEDDDLSEYFSPIKLNYTILEELGFTEHVNDYYYLGKYIVRFDDDEGNFYFPFFEIGDWEMRIEYVHELQNLYFALTGEELELKHESKP